VSATKAEDLVLMPSSLGALALLALNDHVLKGLAPGLLTGKLSDFAGLYFFPFFLLAVAATVVPAAGSPRSLGVVSLLTALVFSCINLSPAASYLYECIVADIWQLFGRARPIRHVADAEDLIALPMVLVAYLVGTCNLSPPSAKAPRSPSPPSPRA